MRFISAMKFGCFLIANFEFFGFLAKRILAIFETGLISFFTDLKPVLALCLGVSCLSVSPCFANRYCERECLFSFSWRPASHSGLLLQTLGSCKGELKRFRCVSKGSDSVDTNWPFIRNLPPLWFSLLWLWFFKTDIMELVCRVPSEPSWVVVVSRLLAESLLIRSRMLEFPLNFPYNGRR